MLLVQEIGRWRCETPRTSDDAERLVRLVTDWVGRRTPDPSLWSALGALAERHRGRDPRLDSFLDTMLSRNGTVSSRNDTVSTRDHV